MKVIRISDELHDKLKTHAEADRRTINSEAEIIFTLYFDDAEGGLTSEQVASNRRADSIMVKEHIVKEGIELGILQPVIPEKKSATAQAPVRSTVAPPAKPSLVIGGVTEEQPCCSAAAPCKHWSYNGADMTWKNQLSGRIKEVAV